MQTLLPRDVLDVQLFQDRRKDLRLATTVRAVLHVGGVGLYALVGQSGAGDAGARLLQRLAVAGAAAQPQEAVGEGALTVRLE